MKKILVSVLAALAMVVGGAVPAHAAGTQTFAVGAGATPTFTGAVTLSLSNGTVTPNGSYTFSSGTSQAILKVESYLAVCDSNPTALTTPSSNGWGIVSGANNCAVLVDSNGNKQLYSLAAATGQSDTEVSSASVQLSSAAYKDFGGMAVPVTLTSKYLALVTRISATSAGYFVLSAGVQWPYGTPSALAATALTGQYPGIRLAFTGEVGAGTYYWDFSTDYNPSGAAGNGTWTGGTWNPGQTAAAAQTVDIMNSNHNLTSGSYYFRVKKESGAFAYTSTPFVHTVGQAGGSSSSSSSTPVVTVPVFKQPKFAMPSKIDVDTTGKVSLSGKDMGVSTVLIGGKEQKIDINSDEKLVFDTTGLAKGVHDLVMKGAFGTYTIQKAIQVGEAVVTKVAAVSARQVGMAGGELSISGVGLEGTTQITMNGQILEIISKTDSKVTFKVPASTVASVNSIMIEGSFVPVLFKNAFSYTK